MRNYRIDFINITPPWFDYKKDNNTIILLFPKLYEPLRITLLDKDKEIIDRLLDIKDILWEEYLKLPKVDYYVLEKNTIIKNTIFKIMGIVVQRSIDTNI